MRRDRGCPGVQPGDFPRGLGAGAGVPIKAKTAAKAFAVRPGESWGEAFCQGSGESCTSQRANQSCQVSSGIKSLQR